MSWQDQGACRGRNELDWFFERYGRTARGRPVQSGWAVPEELRKLVPPDVAALRRAELAEVAEMKRLCDSCPVRGECLSFAAGPPAEQEGVWGGVWSGQEMVSRTNANGNGNGKGNVNG